MEKIWVYTVKSNEGENKVARDAFGRFAVYSTRKEARLYRKEGLVTEGAVLRAIDADDHLFAKAPCKR